MERLISLDVAKKCVSKLLGKPEEEIGKEAEAMAIIFNVSYALRSELRDWDALAAQSYIEGIGSLRGIEPFIERYKRMGAFLWKESNRLRELLTEVIAQEMF